MESTGATIVFRCWVMIASASFHLIESGISSRSVDLANENALIRIGGLPRRSWQRGFMSYLELFR